MTWYRFRAQGARNVAGAVVSTGSGVITELGNTTAVPLRATVANGQPVAVGTGPVISAVAVAQGVTEEFDADLSGPEGYWRSGSAPAVYVVSASGAMAAVVSSNNAVQLARSDALAAANASQVSAQAAQAALADLDARPGSGHIVLATETTPVPSGLPEDTLVVVLGA